MNKKLIVIIGIVLVIVGCNNHEDTDLLSKQTVIVAGRIDNASSKVVEIAFQDIIRGQARFSQIIDTLTGNFKFVFDVYHAQDMRFKHDEKLIRLFIEPSDSLFITIDANDYGKDEIFWSNVTFSGNNTRVNKEILDYSLITETLSFPADCEGKSVKQYLTELEQQVKNEEKEFKRFVKERKPSDKFIQWAQKDILYSNANYLINYKAYLFYNKLPRTDSLFRTNLFPVNDKNALVSSMFGLHLWHYATDRYIQNDSIVMISLEAENFLDAYTKCIENVLKEEPGGIIRDIIVYKLLSSLIEESLDDFECLWNESNMLIDNKLLSSELNKREFQVKNANNYSIGYLEDFTKEEKEFVGDIFTEILEKSEDKSLYVDIWATWCGPCRAEIPYLIEIHDKLTKENTEFISICCNSDRVTWNLLIKENKLPGKHYFLDNTQTDIFRSKLKFPGYPTYLIIRDRKILSKNAPRPSAEDKLLSAIRTITTL